MYTNKRKEKGKGNMRVYKEKQFIIFEFEDLKTVKYNLATGETIGKNNRIVKSLNNQLRGYSIRQIIDCVTDENYRNFLTFVNKEVNRSQQRRGGYGWNHYDFVSESLVDRITNVGSFLDKISDYSVYEQYFACGLTNVDLDSRSRNRITCSLGDIPKGLIKICKQYGLRLNSELLKAYNNIPNLYPTLLDMEFNTITKENILNLLITYGINFKGQENAYYGYGVSKSLKIKFLVENYNYNIKALLTYLDNLMTYEAIENFEHLCNEFYDYVKMAGKISAKFDKYPRYFLSTHRITCRNYERLRQVFEEQDFAKRINLEYEYKIGDYKFIYPKTTQDIKDEAVQQSHCVASYIQNVIDGRCHIMFLRKRNENLPKEEQYNKSLITLEIRESRVVQARGLYNRDTTQEEKELIAQFEKHLEKINNKNTKEKIA